MARLIIAAVTGGILFGKLILPASLVPALDTIVTYSLAIMVFGVGIDIGTNRAAWRHILSLGWRVLLVPAAVAAGSLLGAGLAAPVLAMPLKEVLAVGAGLGWYSLSGPLIAQIYNAELGTIAFLANMSRELLAFVIIPLVARIAGSVAAIAPGGATAMDSTLPVVTKVTDSKTGLMAFVSGLVLTLVVPVLIPFILT